MKVNVEPVGQTNGDQMIQFQGNAGKKPETWTFETQQNHLYVANEGTEQIEVKAGGETRTIPPGESWGDPLNYSSVEVRALTDDEDQTQPFTVMATVYGLPGADRVPGILDNLKDSIEVPKQQKEEKQQKK